MIREMESVPFDTENTAPGMYVEGCGFRGDGIYTTPGEVEQAIELMGEEAYIEDFVDDPELLGAFFKKWARKRKRRKRKMKLKMRGMSKSQRRKFKRKMRRKRRKKITKAMFMRFLPGSRVLAAIKLRRKLKGKDTNLMRAWKKKKARKRKASKRRAVTRQRMRGPVTPIAPIYTTPQITDDYAPDEEYREDEYREDLVRPDPLPFSPEVEVQKVQKALIETEGKKPGMDMQKMLPIIGAAGLGAFLLMQQGKKKKR